MVSCKQCNGQNSLDSAFCKKCGATLDANDITIANEKLTTMIADGNRLFADSRTEDALLVAETAVAHNPSSAAAISLKGMCLERKGMLAEALECFERVVQLEPDSTLDKLKVNDLKNMLVVEKFEVNRTPDRRVAVMGAVAAGLLVVAVGAIFAKANASSNETPKNLVAMNDATKPLTFSEVLPTQNPVNQNQPTTQAPPAVDPNQQPNFDGNTGRGNTGRPNLNLDRYNGGSIPRPNGGAESSIPPVRVELPNGGLPPTGGSNQETQPQPPAGPNRDPDPGTLNSGGNDQTTPAKPANDPGIIEIEVSKGSPNRNGSNGGSASPNTGNGRQALIATARNQMQTGNYAAAASTYERALRAGADQASTNQRLGQCYSYMGRNGDAIAAYTRAAAAFEKAGNTQGAEASRQAIKVLGG